MKRNIRRVFQRTISFQVQTEHSKLQREPYAISPVTAGISGKSPCREPKDGVRLREDNCFCCNLTTPFSLFAKPNRRRVECAGYFNENGMETTVSVYYSTSWNAFCESSTELNENPPARNVAIFYPETRKMLLSDDTQIILNFFTCKLLNFFMVFTTQNSWKPFST